jgi:hypothetical protein
MQAELRYLSSPEFDPETGYPADPQCFCALIEAFVGPAGGLGEEAFRMHVCTPQWLHTRTDGGEHLWGDGFLIVPNWDYDRILSTIRHRIESVNGSSWDEIARRLGEWTAWEFDRGS